MDYSTLLSRCRQRNLRKPIQKPDRRTEADVVTPLATETQAPSTSTSARQQHELDRQSSSPQRHMDNINNMQMGEQSQQPSHAQTMEESNSVPPSTVESPTERAEITSSRRETMQKSQSTRDMEEKYKALLNRSRQRPPRQARQLTPLEEQPRTSSFDKDTPTTDSQTLPPRGPAHRDLVIQEETRGSPSRSNRSSASSRTDSSPPPETPQLNNETHPVPPSQSQDSIPDTSSPWSLDSSPGKTASQGEVETTQEGSTDDIAGQSVGTENDIEEKYKALLNRSRRRRSQQPRNALPETPRNDSETPPGPPPQSRDSTPGSSSLRLIDSSLGNTALQSKVKSTLEGSMDSLAGQSTGDENAFVGADVSMHSKAVESEISMDEAHDGLSRRSAQLQGYFERKHEVSVNSRGAGTLDSTIVSLGLGNIHRTTPEISMHSRTGEVSEGEAREIDTRGQGIDIQRNNGPENDESEGTVIAREKSSDVYLEEISVEEGKEDEREVIMDAGEESTFVPDPWDTDPQQRSPQSAGPDAHFYDPNSSEESEQPSLASTDQSSVEVEYVDSAEERTQESNGSRTEVEYLEEELSVEASTDANQGPEVTDASFRDEDEMPRTASIEIAEQIPHSRQAMVREEHWEENAGTELEIPNDVNLGELEGDVRFQSDFDNFVPSEPSYNASYVEGRAEGYDSQHRKQREVSLTSKDLLDKRNPSSFTVPSFYEDSQLANWESTVRSGDAIFVDSGNNMFQAEEGGSTSEEVEEGGDDDSEKYGVGLAQAPESGSRSRSPPLPDYADGRGSSDGSSISSHESEARKHSDYSPQSHLMQRVEIEGAPGSSSSDESSDDEIIPDGAADIGAFPVEPVNDGYKIIMEQMQSPRKAGMMSLEMAVGLRVDIDPVKDLADSSNGSVSSTDSMKKRSFDELVENRIQGNDAPDGAGDKSNQAPHAQELARKQDVLSSREPSDADEMINARYGELRNKHILESVLSSRKAKGSSINTETIFSKEKDLLLKLRGSRDDRTLIFPWETWELRRLLLLWAEGHNVDEERLQELGLLNKWKHCEDLTTDEAKYVENVRKRRRLVFDHYKNEFESILQKVSLGETIAEEQINYLQLYARRTIGDFLSPEEIVMLNELEKGMEEKIIREFNEDSGSSSTDSSKISAYKDSPSLASASFSSRASDRFYMEEFEDLITKCENGEAVDEDRFICLQLYGRKRAGQKLSEYETSRLESFLAAERLERLNLSNELINTKALVPPPPLDAIDLKIEVNGTPPLDEKLILQDEAKMDQIRDLVKRKLLAASYDKDSIDDEADKVMKMSKRQIKAFLLNPLEVPTESPKSQNTSDGSRSEESATSHSASSDGSATDIDNDNGEDSLLSEDDMMMIRIRAMVREKLWASAALNEDEVDATVQKVMRMPKPKIKEFLQNPLPANFLAPAESTESRSISADSLSEKSSSSHSSSSTNESGTGGDDAKAEAKELSADEIMMNKIRDMVREKLLASPAFDEDNVDKTVDQVMKLPKPKIKDFLQNPLPASLMTSTKSTESQNTSVDSQSEKSSSSSSCASEDSQTAGGDAKGEVKELTADEIMMNKIRDMVREKLLASPTLNEDNVGAMVAKVMEMPKPKIKEFLQNPLPASLMTPVETAESQSGSADSQSEKSSSSRSSGSDKLETSGGKDHWEAKELSEDEIMMVTIRAKVREKLWASPTFDEEDVDAMVEKVMGMPEPKIEEFLQNPLRKGLVAPDVFKANHDMSQREFKTNQPHEILSQKLLTPEAFETVEKVVKSTESQIEDAPSSNSPKTALDKGLSNQHESLDRSAISNSGSSDGSGSLPGDGKREKKDFSQSEVKDTEIRDLVRQKLLTSNAFNEENVDETVDKVMQLPPEQIEAFFPVSLATPTAAVRKILRRSLAQTQQSLHDSIASIFSSSTDESVSSRTSHTNHKVEQEDQVVVNREEDEVIVVNEAIELEKLLNVDPFCSIAPPASAQSSSSSSTSEPSSSSSSSSASSSSDEFKAPSDIQFRTRDFSASSRDGSSDTSTISSSDSSSQSSTSDSTSSSSGSSRKRKPSRSASAEDEMQSPPASPGIALFEDDALSPSVEDTKFLPFFQLELSAAQAPPYVVGTSDSSRSESSDEYGFDRGASKSGAKENPFQRNWNGNLPYKKLQTAGEGTVEEDRPDTTHISSSWRRSQTHQQRGDGVAQQFDSTQDSPQSTSSERSPLASLPFHLENDISRLAAKGAKGNGHEFCSNDDSEEETASIDQPSAKSPRTSSESSDSAGRQSRYDAYRNFLKSGSEERIWSNDKGSTFNANTERYSKEAGTARQSSEIHYIPEEDNIARQVYRGDSIEIKEAVEQKNSDTQLQKAKDLFSSLQNSNQTNSALKTTSLHKQSSITRNVPKVVESPKANRSQKVEIADARLGTSNTGFKEAKELFISLSNNRQTKESSKPSFIQEQRSDIKFFPEENDSARRVYRGENDIVNKQNQMAQESPAFTKETEREASTAELKFKQVVKTSSSIEIQKRITQSPKPTPPQKQSSKITYIPGADDEARRMYRADEVARETESPQVPLDSKGARESNQQAFNSKAESPFIRYIPEEDDYARMIYRGGTLDSKEKAVSGDTTVSDTSVVTEQFQRTAFLLPGSQVPSKLKKHVHSSENYFSTDSNARGKASAAERATLEQRKQAAQAMASAALSKLNHLTHVEKEAISPPVEAQHEVAHDLLTPQMPKRKSIDRFHLSPLHVQNYDVYTGSPIVDSSSSEDEVSVQDSKQWWSLFSFFKFGKDTKSKNTRKAKSRKPKVQTISGAIANIELEEFKKNSPSNVARPNAAGRDLKEKSGNVELRHVDPTRGNLSSPKRDDLKSTLASVQLRHVSVPQPGTPTASQSQPMQSELQDKLKNITLRHVPKGDSPTKPISLEDELKSKLANQQLRTVTKAASPTNSANTISMEDELKSKLANRQLRSVIKPDSPTSPSKPLSLEDELKTRLVSRQLRPVSKQESPPRAATSISIEDELRNKLARRKLRSESLPQQESSANAAAPMSMQDELRGRLASSQLRRVEVPEKESPQNKEPKRMVQLRPTKVKTAGGTSEAQGESSSSYDADAVDQMKNSVSSSIARKKAVHVHFQLPSDSGTKDSAQLIEPTGSSIRAGSKPRSRSRAAEWDYDVEVGMESSSVSSSESSSVLTWSPTYCTTLWQFLVRTSVCLLLVAAIALPVYFLQFHDRNVHEKDIGPLNLFPASEFVAADSDLTSNSTIVVVEGRQNIFSHSLPNDP